MYVQSSLSPSGSFCTVLQTDVRLLVRVSLSAQATQRTQLHSDACTRLNLCLAPDGRLSKPVYICLCLLRLKA